MRASYEFARYRQPVTTATALAMTPRLESWDAKSAPSQLALGRYLDYVAELTRERLAELGGAALSLELVVGLPDRTDPLRGGYDLDNFLYPVVRRLGSHRFACARASKKRGTVSTVRIGQAVLADTEDLGAWSFASAETSSSTSRAAWKREIADQIEPIARVAPDGPLELELALAVASRRNWAWLWKPAIDSLSAILGVEDARRPFSTRDDRIVRLALHRTIDETLGNRVRVGVWWRAA